MVAIFVLLHHDAMLSPAGAITSVLFTGTVILPNPTLMRPSQASL